MNKLFIGLFFILAQSSVVYSQSGINEITFNFRHSLRIPDHHVTIHIENYRHEITVKVKSEPLKGYEKEWGHTRIDTTYKITADVFQQLTQSVLLIDGNSIIKRLNDRGMDGTVCEIKFGSFQNAVSYKFWSPQYNTKQRNLDSFLDACKLIIRTGKLDPKEIL